MAGAVELVGAAAVEGAAALAGTTATSVGGKEEGRIRGLK